jgi:hypothetical protein
MQCQVYIFNYLDHFAYDDTDTETQWLMLWESEHSKIQVFGMLCVYCSIFMGDFTDEGSTILQNLDNYLPLNIE